MSKVSYIEIEGVTEDAYYKTVKAQDRFITSRVTKNFTLLSRKKIATLEARSSLPEFKILWDNFTEIRRANWKSMGVKNGLNGWQMFVQDQSIRIKTGLPGTMSPSMAHQSWIGNINIITPATELKITQLHPRAYYVSQSVTGKKSMRVPVQITEDFSLPLEIELWYSSDLISQGAGSFAKFYAVVWSSYQGENIETVLELNLDLITNWKRASTTLTEVQGYVVGYDLFIHCFNLRGDLYFDNIKIEHSGQNWARDPYCKNINEIFTRAFSQVSKNWSSVILPTGSSYQSIYKDF